jgi:hypothetical protein
MCLGLPEKGVYMPRGAILRGVQASSRPLVVVSPVDGLSGRERARSVGGVNAEGVAIVGGDVGWGRFLVAGGGIVVGIALIRAGWRWRDG